MTLILELTELIARHEMDPDRGLWISKIVCGVGFAEAMRGRYEFTDINPVAPVVDGSIGLICGFPLYESEHMPTPTYWMVLGGDGLPMACGDISE